ncbi:MAG: class I SAM-dependent methyltransferase [Acetobacteraceae bacterium]
MIVRASDIAAFYETPRGAVVARLLNERLASLWPDVRGQSILGIGYTAPFLDPWRSRARRCIACMPAGMGVVRWPEAGGNLACLAEDDGMPFPDMAFDRVLLAHGLETAELPARLLRETWRVLKDDGQMLVVTPNRAGIWTHGDDSPFFLRQTFTGGQIDRLLADALFRTERRENALWLPPTRLRFFLDSAQMLERTGRRLMPGAGGVTITEAIKDVYAALPLSTETAPRRRLALASAA